MPRRRTRTQRLIDDANRYVQANPSVQNPSYRRPRITSDGRWAAAVGTRPVGSQLYARNRLTSVARSVMSRTSQRRFSQTSSARVKSARQSSGSLGVTNNPNYRYITDSSKWRDSDRPVFNRRTGEQIGAYRGV